MDKNYYELLQVDKNASSEIIEKAYKTLAKKYHPDLQTEENKHYAGEILKQINEAYEVLSDLEKRKSYDNSIVENIVLKEYYTKVCRENEILKSELANIKSYSSSIDNNSYAQELENAKKQAYYDAYIQDLKNRGYKIKYKKNFKDYLTIFLSINFTIIILFLLYQIPFVKNFFKNLYIGNSIFRFIINFFNTFLTAIFSIFKK